MILNSSQIAHIELTVRDIEISRRFYEILGLKQVARHSDFIMFQGKGFKLGLTTHNKTENSKFSEFTTGLDHLAFTVKNRSDLEKAVVFFDQNSIPHGEIKELSNGSFVLAFRDPDNIQLELAYK